MNKNDRERIAATLVAAAIKHGATVERRDSPRLNGWNGASIDLTFRLNGVGCLVSVDDLHGGFEGLASWFNTEHPCRDFAHGFAVAVGSYSRFEKPHHKATSYDNWDVLAARISAGFRKAAKGEAFI